MTCEKYLSAFSRLRVNQRGDQISPHKPAMLLAVLALADAGRLKENRIQFSQSLLERYANVFHVVEKPGDHLNPYFPYFHLRSEGFWHLQARPGREAVVEALGSARSIAAIEDNIEFSFLDDELHSLLQDSTNVEQLRAALVIRWFGGKAGALDELFAFERSVGLEEAELRQTVTPDGLPPPPTSDRPVRDAAFRRVVSEAYDYRCAASGWRIILPDGGAIVEAAHLVPFAESHDDDPRNGIALTPSLHWAMDRHIIAPGPDYKWHVSDLVDRRLADNRPLLELAGTDIMLPHDRSFWPSPDSLRWRLDHLTCRTDC